MTGNEEGYCKVSSETTVKSTVGIGPRSEGESGLGISLEVSMPGESKDNVEKLMHPAYEICPCSNATRNNIDVKLSVV